MSINWVMLDEQKNFILLPKERVLYTSPPRTSFSLTTANTYPGKTPLSIQSSAGKAYITNQRLVYLPSSQASTSGTPGVGGQLESFAAPLLNLQDSHVTAPFFGPNAWLAAVRPVTGGGIPANHAYVELKLVFKDGGAFDFQTTYERVREHVLNAIDMAQESGRNVRDAMGDVGGEELPAYEETCTHAAANVLNGTSSGGVARNQASTAGLGRSHLLNGNGFVVPPSGPPPRLVNQHAQSMAVPNEDPPGYEDAQQAGIANSLEESVRRESS